MKTLGLILVLSIGMLVMILTLVPVRTSVEVSTAQQQVVLGKVHVATILVRNDGWFTQDIKLPEMTACIGDQEVPLDGWTHAHGTVVRGAGQTKSITLKPGDEGTIELVASDAYFGESIQVYYRAPHFSCLTPGAPVQ